jgi:hypothetical protein
MVSRAAKTTQLSRPRAFCLTLCAGMVLAIGSGLLAQDSRPASPRSSQDLATKPADPETELQKALADSGNDSAAMVRNLKTYLLKFPDSPRRAGVYRALVEACQQIRDGACALDYAERFIALQPDDSQMMLLAVDMLEERGDDGSLTRAAGYASRVLDRVEKSSPDERPARESAAEWQDGQEQLRAALYYVRGHVENSQRSYDAAVKDLQASYATLPNSLAAKMLGEIAEMRNDPGTAIDQYLLAFALPETGPAGHVDHRQVRRQLGNVWRELHGGDQGLGDAILAAYDKVS